MARKRTSLRRETRANRLPDQVIVERAGDPHPDNLADPARAIHEDHAVHLGRIAATPPDPDRAALDLALALDQHLLDTPNQRLIRAVRGGLRRRHQLVPPPHLDTLR